MDDNIKTILEKNVKSEHDIQVLMEHTRSIEFFNKITVEQDSDQIHKALCRVMYLTEYEAGEYVFRYGDIGSKFFVVLSGRLEVTVPSDLGTYEQIMRHRALAAKVLAPEGIKKNSSSVVRRLNKLKYFVPSETPNQPRDESSFIKVTELTVGKSFGDLSLLKGSTRNATIKCLKPTALLTIKKIDYDRLLRNFETKRLNEKVEFLSRVHCFNKLSKGALEKLSYFFRNRSYKRGDTVYSEGQEAEDIYVIITGEFKFTKRSSSVRQEKSVASFSRIERLYMKMKEAQKNVKPIEMSLMVKGPNEMFGDEDIIGPPIRKYTCKCVMSATVYFIEKQALLRELPYGTSWESIKAKNEMETKWLLTRLETLESTEDMKSTIYLTRDEPEAVTERPRLVRNATETRSSTVFKTEIDLSKTIEVSPLRLNSRHKLSLSGKRSMPRNILEKQLPERTALVSRGARRQMISLRMPKLSIQRDNSSEHRKKSMSAL